MMRTHDLKTWPLPFAAVVAGAKLYEVRKNDRDYGVGDVLNLREWEPTSAVYTGRSLAVVVRYMTHGGEWGLAGDLCIMGIVPKDAMDDPQLLRAELARLRTELEEARAENERLEKKADASIWAELRAHDRRATAEQERDEARAAAGAMREALDEAADKFTVFFYNFRDGVPEKDVCRKVADMCIAARKPAIGADVMRVVEAAKRFCTTQRQLIGAECVDAHRELCASVVALSALTNSAGGE